MSEAKFEWARYFLFCEECRAQVLMGGRARDGEAKLYGDQVLGPLPCFMIEHAGHKLRILDDEAIEEVYKKT